MKKTLIALAAVAAASAAVAQTATIYGRMDLGYNSTKNTDVDGVVTKTTSLAGAEGGRTSSRFGVTGGEDLGGGLKASYVYEVGAAAETGFGTARLANIAVSGGFGTAVIGTFYNIFDDIASDANAAGDHTASFMITNGRSSNAVAYVAPTINGLTLSIGGLNEKKTVTGAGGDTELSGYVLGAKYSAGPLNVWAGYSNADATTSEFLEATLSSINASEMAVKVSYDMGIAVPFMILAKSEIDGSIDPDGSQSNQASLAGELDINGSEIGLTFPMGAFTPFVSYASAKYKLDGATAVKFTGSTVGTTYDLSKRTSAYLELTNQKIKNLTWGDDKTQIIKAGLVHQF